MRKPQKNVRRRQPVLPEEEEIELLNAWIEYGKPNPASNPLSFDLLPRNAQVGNLPDGGFSPYVGCKWFEQLPLSDKTKRGLREGKFFELTDIQRASLPHSLCGRDILGAAKTGSGKTLAFMIPVLEKLYKERWSREDGVGAIILSPTRDLAMQLFEVLRLVGKHHDFPAGLLVGGRQDVDMQKACVNELNILVCTPGRLLQHLDETVNFDCSNLQVLALDEADRILDGKFKKDINPILSQLPKGRQTLLFSATQTKSVKDLARLNLKDPVYLGVHEEAPTATPELLEQIVMVVPLDQKLSMLWQFIKTHLDSRILVFLSTCKQVKFVYKAFSHLRPGIPLKHIHGRMKPELRSAICAEFSEKNSVLFATDVASRGLDFSKAVDWVVQVDCPDVDDYIHRVGRTARYKSSGRSLLFLMPSEEKMLEKLQARKIPIQLNRASKKTLQSISESLAAQLVKFPDLKQLAQRAFITYLKSIHKHSDKEIYDVMKLPVDEFAASLGLPMTPKIRMFNKKTKAELEVPSQMIHDSKQSSLKRGHLGVKESIGNIEDDDEDAEDDFLQVRETTEATADDDLLATRLLKKKKLKINIHKPVGTKIVFDDGGDTQDPLAAIATDSVDKLSFHPEMVQERLRKMREEFKKRDQEDKILHSKRLKEKRSKEKEKRRRMAEEEEDTDGSASDSESTKPHNKKVKFNEDSDASNDDGNNNEENKLDSVSVAEQEALALKLLSSMH